MNRAIPTGQGSKIQKNVRRRLPSKKKEAPRSEDTHKTKSRGCWGSKNKFDPKQQTVESETLTQIPHVGGSAPGEKKAPGAEAEFVELKRPYDYDSAQEAETIRKKLAKNIITTILDEIRELGEGNFIAWDNCNDANGESQIYIYYSTTRVSEDKKILIKRQITPEDFGLSSEHVDISDLEYVLETDVRTRGKNQFYVDQKDMILYEDFIKSNKDDFHPDQVAQADEDDVDENVVAIDNNVNVMTSFPGAGDDVEEEEEERRRMATVKGPSNVLPELEGAEYGIEVFAAPTVLLLSGYVVYRYLSRRWRQSSSHASSDITVIVNG